ESTEIQLDAQQRLEVLRRVGAASPAPLGRGRSRSRPGTLCRPHGADRSGAPAMSAVMPPLPNGPAADDELGAHVSTAGGVWNAPERARALDSGVLQRVTERPNRWAEPQVDEESAERFRGACEEHRIRVTAAHDSYLINLASPDPRLRAM